MASFSALTKWFSRTLGMSLPESEVRQLFDSAPDGHVGKRLFPPGAAGIGTSFKKYATIPVPALAIFAIPHDQGPWIKASTDPAVQQAAKDSEAVETSLTERQAKAVEEAVPTAHVVRIPFANHLIFLSNQADVLREMRKFLSGLGNN